MLPCHRRGELSAPTDAAEDARCQVFATSNLRSGVGCQVAFQTLQVNGHVVNPCGPAVYVAWPIGVEAGAAAIEEMDFKAGRRDVRAALTVPAAVTRNAVQEHDASARRGGSLPHAHSEPAAVAR